MTNAQLTQTDRLYIAAYENIILAVSNVTSCVSSTLRQQVDTLEDSMSAGHIDQLRDIARGGW